MSEIMNEALANTFVGLCAKKPVDKITVNDIITACGVSKQTFYNHFRDKQELMNYVYKHELDGITRTVGSQAPTLEDANEIAQSVMEYLFMRKPYFMAIASYHTQNSFEEFFVFCARDYLIHAIKARMGTADCHIQRMIDFNCAGIGKVVMDWIRGGMKEAPHDYTCEVMNFISEDLKAIIRH